MKVDFVAVSVVIGALLPLVISFLKNVRRSWPTQVVKAFALVVALVAAVVQTGVDLGWSSLNFADVLASFGVIYALAQTTFKGIWQGTSIEAGLALTFDRSSGYEIEDLAA